MSDIYSAKITENMPLTDGVYSITLECAGIARIAQPGQFMHIKCGHSRLLRRPISICSVFDDNVRIVFEVKGEGTKWLAARNSGETLDVLGPLGNGFEIPDEPFIVVGGGIGTPPLLFAAQSARCDVTAVLGFRSKDRIILQDVFRNTCKDTIISTDDGSAGIHGTIAKPLEDLLSTRRYSAVLACGPVIMLKAVAGLCEPYQIPCQVSLEERMGCGVGACLVCACRTKIGGAPDMSRVCADGPVFNACNVAW